MSSSVRKSIRVPGPLMREIDRLNPEKGDFSKIATKALRLWVGRQRRRHYAAMVERAAQQRTPEQEAEDRALVRIASESGRKVLEKEERRG